MAFNFLSFKSNQKKINCIYSNKPFSTQVISNYNITFLILVAHWAIKTQLLVALVSFKSPLGTGRLPIISPEFVLFTDPFLSVLGMYMSAVISDVAFSNSEGTWKISVIYLSQLTYQGV